MTDDTLTTLQRVIDERKTADPKSSYVASLHHRGLNKIAEKVGEECIETIIAAKDAERSGDNRQLVYETADLWFHCMVMLSSLDESVDSVVKELEQRFGISGIAEKLSRKP